MSFIALVNHGLSGIGAFSDVVYSRLLAFAMALVALLGLSVVAGVVIRILTGTALPGWLALGAAISALALVQVVATLLVVSFVTSSMRSLASAIPVLVAPTLVSGQVRLQAGTARPADLDD